MDMSLSKLRELVMDREAWHAAVHGVAKSQTWLSDWTELTGTQDLNIELHSSGGMGWRGLHGWKEVGEAGRWISRGSTLCTPMVYSVNVPWKHHTKWKKPDTKEHTFYDLFIRNVQNIKSMEIASIWCCQGLSARANGDWLLMGTGSSSGWWKCLELDSAGDGQDCEWTKCHLIIHFKLVCYQMWTSSSF